MSYTLSPYNTPNTMSAHLATSHRTRRTSRSSGSQPGGGYSYRIEKSRSNHNSPMTAERRRTTTGTRLYATLDDHYNMMMGFTGNDDDEEDNDPKPSPTRPMSWHPSSTHFGTQPRSAVYEPNLPQDWSRQYPASSRNSTHGSDFYSLSARNSTYADPLQNYPPKYNNDDTHRGSQDSGSSMHTRSQSYAMSPHSTEPMPWYLQEWARRNQAEAINSHNGSADFLPIQHPTMDQDTNLPDDEDMDDEGKELVGMGLYDLPDSALAWGSPLVEATGKGLKLEETWQPPPEEDDDEGEAEGDDASSDDGEEELPPPPPPPAKQERAPLQVPAAIKPQMPGSMEGQSFFFDDDDNGTKEWLFQQLKQPSLPVRDAGIGYGWL